MQKLTNTLLLPSPAVVYSESEYLLFITDFTSGVETARIKSEFASWTSNCFSSWLQEYNYHAFSLKFIPPLICLILHEWKQMTMKYLWTVWIYSFWTSLAHKYCSFLHPAKWQLMLTYDTSWAWVTDPHLGRCRILFCTPVQQEPISKDNISSIQVRYSQGLVPECGLSFNALQLRKHLHESNQSPQLKTSTV